MIRNIVFDMGNVLIDYQPMKYTRRFFPDPSEAAQVCTELFGGPEWPLLPLVRSTDHHPRDQRARQTNEGKRIPPIYPLECRLQLLSILFLYPNLPAVGRLYRLRRRKVGET